MSRLLLLLIITACLAYAGADLTARAVLGELPQRMQRSVLQADVAADKPECRIGISKDFASRSYKTRTTARGEQRCALYPAKKRGPQCLHLNCPNNED